MIYDQNVWLTYYRKIDGIGRRIKNGNLNSFERNELEKQADDLRVACGCYLDSCAMRMPLGKWIYVYEDKTTWRSDPSFAYRDLCNTRY